MVCNGCCCGRVEKGHNEVPIQALKTAWDEYGLDANVKLTISNCLGPCSMHNVTILKIKDDLTWLGNLNGDRHYDALIQWALDYNRNGNDAVLPEILAHQRFERTQKLIIREQTLDA